MIVIGQIKDLARWMITEQPEDYISSTGHLSHALLPPFGTSLPSQALS
jgi:hypothetical protein